MWCWREGRKSQLDWSCEKYLRDKYCAWQRPPATRPATFYVWKTRGCQCSFRLLMMDGVSPETCWTSYKYGIIKFDTLLHLFGFFFMNFTMMYGSMNVKPMVGVVTFLVIFLCHVLYLMLLALFLGLIFQSHISTCFQICSVDSSFRFSYSSPLVNFTICCKTYEQHQLLYGEIHVLFL
jgi:hypothetical protein